MPNHNKCQNKTLLVDDETWAFIFEPALCDDPDTAESLAYLLYSIVEAIESGPEGVKQASETLLEGIKYVYSHTDAYKAALKLYRLSLTGRLHPQNEPLRLINAAIERGTAEVKYAIATERKRKYRGKR
jgi:hypothetical protein